jgi:hypothetical protein
VAEDFLLVILLLIFQLYVAEDFLLVILLLIFQLYLAEVCLLIIFLVLLAPLFIFITFYYRSTIL